MQEKTLHIIQNDGTLTTYLAIFTMTRKKCAQEVNYMAASTTISWGYILEGPGRPDLETQRRIMALSGIQPENCSRDKLTPRATRPRSVLIEREELIGRPRSGDRVVVATLLCLGLSRNDVSWFVGKLHDRGVSVVVHDGARVLEPHRDLDDLLDDFDRARNALYVRRSRRKAQQAE